MEWYYAVDGQSYGPISEQEFATLVAQRTIQPETLVWQEGMDDWLPYGRMLGSAEPKPWDTEPVAGHSSGRNSGRSTTFLGSLGDAFGRYADFSGRSTRAQYWFFTLWSFIILFVTLFVDITLASNTKGPNMFFLIAILVLFVPSLAVTVRRLHDAGFSGWFYLISIVPMLGSIALLIMFCLPSDPRQNKWGWPVQ